MRTFALPLRTVTISKMFKKKQTRDFDSFNIPYYQNSHASLVCILSVFFSFLEYWRSLVTRSNSLIRHDFVITGCLTVDPLETNERLPKSQRWMGYSQQIAVTTKNALNFSSGFKLEIGFNLNRIVSWHVLVKPEQTIQRYESL